MKLLNLTVGLCQGDVEAMARREVDVMLTRDRRGIIATLYASLLPIKAGFATNRIKANQGSDLPYPDEFEAAFALFGADPVPIRIIRVRAVAKGGSWRG